MSELTIDLLRHGEPIGGKKYRGQTDDALTNAGWQAMDEMVALSPSQTWDKIISSNLSRCSEYAQKLALSKKIAVTFEENFQEINFGVWEGKTAEEIEQEFPHTLLEYYKKPYDNTPQDAESLKDFEKRVLTAWHELILMVLEQNIKHVLFISHSGVMRTILSEVLQIERLSTYHFDLPYATFIRLKLYIDVGDVYAQIQHYAIPRKE